MVWKLKRFKSRRAEAVISPPGWQLDRNVLHERQ
jgi:hypothetical protein